MSHTKTIGIWGMGVVGTSLTKFCTTHAIPYITYDHKNNTHAHSVLTLDELFKRADMVIPSPGIDVHQLSTQHMHKIVPEIDLFFQYWKKPVITITGTVGKTSTTTLLTQALQKTGIQAVMGGNIGTGMFDLFEQYTPTQLAVLELSSYQLEHARHCMPTLSIITNLYPNHLDRHKTMCAYAQAKFKSLHTHNLVHAGVLPYLENEKFSQCVSAIFSVKRPQIIQKNRSYFYCDSQGSIVHEQDGTKKQICPVHAIPKHSFIENWLCIAAALWLQGHTTIETMFLSLCAQTKIPEHRMQTVGHYNNITYINDSKATLMESTYAALEKLTPNTTILLLGGLSKGVDRIPLIKKLKNKTKYCVCFGAESQELYQACKQAKIPSACTQNMETALQKAREQAQPGDTILLSPGGSSFDLFDNFEHRGKIFTQLVQKLSSNCSS